MCRDRGKWEHSVLSAQLCCELTTVKKNKSGRSRAFIKQMLISPVQPGFHQHKCNTTVYCESFYFQIQKLQYFVNNKLYEYRLKVIKDS